MTEYCWSNVQFCQVIITDKPMILTHFSISAPISAYKQNNPTFKHKFLVTKNHKKITFEKYIKIP